LEERTRVVDVDDIPTTKFESISPTRVEEEKSVAKEMEVDQSTG
jgi:hypothetical protein